MKDFEVLNGLSDIDSRLCNACVNGKPNKFCKHFLTCPFQRTGKFNTTINTFENNGKREIVFYNKTRIIPSHFVDSTKQIDRSRKFVKDENGYKIPKNDSVLLSEYIKTKQSSRERSVDQIYGFAQNHIWKYFVTVTFSSGRVDRFDDDSVKYCWQKFRQRLQYRYPGIEILLINEHHSLGGLHFHALFNNCDLSQYLRIAINKSYWQTYYDKVTNTKVFKRDSEGNLIKNKYYLEPLKSSFGDQVYNLDRSIYEDGYVTVVKIREGSDSSQITNYLTKYVSKDSFSVKDEQRAYYRTHNLIPKKKESKFLTSKEQEDLMFQDSLLSGWKTEHVKRKDNLISVMQKKVDLG